LSRRYEGTLVPPSVSVLEPFVAAGVFDSAEVQLAAVIARLQPDVPDEVLLALALAARGPRLGHVCVEPAAVREVVGASDDDRLSMLPWPEPDHWSALLTRSGIVANPAESAQLPLRPLVWDGTLLYLHRYWHHECTVAERLRALASAGTAGPPPPELAAALDLAFPADRGGAFPSDRGACRADQDGTASPVDRQRFAAERALTNRISVIAGGPGTGKTHTIAGLLEAAHLMASSDGDSLNVALAAPTGKAAARMAEAIGRAALDGEAAGRIPTGVAQAIVANPPTTLHRLLGPLPGARFRHDRHHPLPHDLVVVDEASMVSLPLMAALLAAIRPEACLVLVGDPHQLASVEAGSVLRDLVGPLVRASASLPFHRLPFAGLPSASLPSTGQTSVGQPRPAEPDTSAWGAGRSGDQAGRRALANTGAINEEGPAMGPLAGRVTVLRRARRFSDDSAIASLADAIRAGDADRAVEILDGPSPELTWLDTDDPTADSVLAEEVIDASAEVVRAARAGEALIGLRAAVAVKVLSATRAGVRQWSDRIERGLAGRDPGFEPRHHWYVGRPVMVTANDHLHGLANGDVGLVVSVDGRSQVALETGGSLRLVEPARLGQVETWWAMTIHKSQGSEFDHAMITLPDHPSPILSRELLYTAVTRARLRVTVVGSEARVREAVTRGVSRASGLGIRLWPPVPQIPQIPAAIGR
jgi:exodeoxyribonuclease V alpha subunit